METGDIILIPFPFADSKDVKVRPAIFIAETADKYNDLIVAAISSVITDNVTRNEVIIQPNSVSNLSVSSVIKVDRIVTLKNYNKVANLGKLNFNETERFKKIFRSLV